MQERADALQPIQDELLQLELDRIRQGGQATPEQLALIDQASAAALASGESDINRFQEDALTALREELAPQLGLRSGDTPIMDRGQLVAREAVRQKGQLASQLAGVRATSALNYPLAAGQLGSAQTQFQQSLAQSAQDFQAQLRDSAFVNRLNLLGTQGQLGLGLASGLGSNLASAQAGLAAGRGATQTSSQPLGLGSVLGGAGALLQGLGAIGASSSRDFKNLLKEADAKDILNAIRRMKVHRWTYKHEKTEHAGPTAEDFRKAFDLGDGRSIAFIDAIGVLFAAVKELAARSHARQREMEAGHA